MPALRPRALHDIVVATLGKQVVGGDVAPGTILDLDAIRADLEVSRTVLREALRVLADKGLVGARTRVGTYVQSAEHWKLLDEDVLRWELEADGRAAMYEQFGEMRALIEPGAAALAARRRDDEHVVTLERAVDVMASSDEDPAAIVEADLDFHRTIYLATGNSLVRRQGLLIEIGLRARDMLVHEHHISIQRGLGLHVEVARAIRDQDADAAERLMAELVASATADAAQVSGGDSRGAVPTD